MTLIISKYSCRKCFAQGSPTSSIIEKVRVSPENGMYARINMRFCLAHVAADVVATMERCPPCGRNILKLRKRTNPMKLFPAGSRIVSFDVDIMGPLPKSKSKRTLLLAITGRLSKLKQSVPFGRIDSYTVARAFAENLVFKYGEKETVFTDKGLKNASELFHRVSVVMGIIPITTFAIISNAFESTYHPETNVHAGLYSRTVYPNGPRNATLLCERSPTPLVRIRTSTNQRL